MDQRADITAGLELPALPKGPYTSSHLVRWCAAQQNWDKIHYDRAYAIDYAGLPERVINGALKQHIIMQFLASAFPEEAWVWTVKFRFVAPDLVNEALEVRGTVSSVDQVDGAPIAHVDFEIWNLQQAKVTTAGTATVGLGGRGAPASSQQFPQALKIACAARAPGEGVPAGIEAWIGTQWERISSHYPVDLSRLRLFCDALGEMSPIHFDPEAGRASPYGTVVAPPLFPLHALEGRPDGLPLSSEPGAMGREGVNEMGRNLGRRLGLPGAGMINGGSDIEVHSLLRLGETVHAVGRLVAADVKTGRSGEPMLITQVLNEYFAQGRLLVRELQTTMYRKIFQ